MALFSAAALLFVSAPASASTAPTETSTDTTQAAILAEINFARTHPQDYARRLMLQPVSVWEAEVRAGGDVADPGAFAEAVAFLLRQPPRPPLTPDQALRAAAEEHVDDQGAAGEVGHDGPDGEPFSDRIARHGVDAATLAEDIAYGPSRAEDVVRELVIDRGVPGRGHRRIIFSDALQAAGADCGAHKTFGTMCVIDFASQPAPVELAAPPQEPVRRFAWLETRLFRFLR